MTRSQAIIKYNELDTSRIVLGKPIKNKHGGKFVRVQYLDPRDNVPKELVIVFPYLRAPFGVKEWEAKEAGKDPSYSLSLTLDESQEHATEVHEMMKKLQDFLYTSAGENGGEWLNQDDLTPQTAKMLCNPLIKVSKPKDGVQYPPNLQMKFPPKRNREGKDEDTFDVSVRMSLREAPEYPTKQNFSEKVPPGSRVRGLMSCSGIWLAQKASLVFRAAQLQVLPGATRLQENAIESVFDSDDEGEDLGAETVPYAGDSEDASGAGDNQVADSDDDTSESEEEQPPSPVAAAKPVRGRKRKADVAPAGGSAAKR